MKKLISSLFALAMIAAPTVLLAQSTSSQDLTLTVSGSNLIKIMNAAAAGPDPGTTAISLSLSGATEAGAAINPVAEDISTRLRMSCLTANTEKRKITAKITTNGSNFTGKHSNLKLGLLTPTNEANLNNFVNFDDADEGVDVMQTLATTEGAVATDVALISNMTTSWTGTNAGDGYIIRYEYSADPQTTPQSVGGIAVTFTIAAQ